MISAQNGAQVVIGHIKLYLEKHGDIVQRPWNTMQSFGIPIMFPVMEIFASE